MNSFNSCYIGVAIGSRTLSLPLYYILLDVAIYYHDRKKLPSIFSVEPALKPNLHDGDYSNAIVCSVTVSCRVHIM